MGGYSKSLSTRLRRTLKPFRKVSFENVVGAREDVIRKSSRPGHNADFYDYYKTKEHWVNDEYYAILDKECSAEESRLIGAFLLDHPVWHLRIYRTDGGRIHDWCIIQSIKNEIVGPEYEAIELYPAQSRLMDEGNCYHLWVIAPNEGETKPPTIPLGYRNGPPQRLMLKQAFERLSPRERQEIIAKGGMVAIFPDELIPHAEKEFPEETVLVAIEKYVENHPDIVALLEKWPAKQNQAA